MSIGLRLSSGKELEARVTQILPGEEVRIGDYEMSLDEFSGMASHLLGGGLFGWSGQITPEPVNKALSKLFEMYEQVGDGWVRKAKYQPPAFLQGQPDSERPGVGTGMIVKKTISKTSVLNRASTTS
jgi:hypothetical protein